MKFSHFTKYLFELFVVFLGVYLAFIFTDYQEETERKKIRIKYYNSLVFEFEVFSKHLDDENKKIESYLELINRINNGERPQLVQTNLLYLYKNLMVNSAFEGNNFESLDEDILRSLIRGTPLLLLLDKKTSKLENLIRTILIPAQLSANQEFYDSTGKLLMAFEWYPRLIKEIHQTNRILHQIVVSNAIPDMKKQIEILRTENVFGS